MKDNMEKHLDELSKKIVKEQEFSLPDNFTQQVMSRIEVLPSATAYKPLISRKGWFGILTGFLVTIFLVLKGEGESTPWLEQMGLSNLDFKTGELLGNLQFSNILLYSVLLFSVFIAVQIALVKRQQEQQLQF